MDTNFYGAISPKRIGLGGANNKEVGQIHSPSTNLTTTDRMQWMNRKLKRHKQV